MIQHSLHAFNWIICFGTTQAQDLCTKCGQPWLSAALEGWRLAHDPNYQSMVASDQIVKDATGNVFRDTWKAVCWRLADDVSHS